jgi:uncharacterized protein (DUF58 family)
MQARSSRELSVTYKDVRRGIYNGGSLMLSSKAPFGLSCSKRRLDQDGSLVVYPRWHMLAGDWSSGLMSAGYLFSGAVATRNPTSDYLGVREYRTEDSPRSIHWKTSARSNRLTVVEYARHTAMTPVFIIDPCRRADIGGGAASSFETCIIAAASLVQREAMFNRRFGIGTSLQDATVTGLGHEPEAAMLKLAGLEADAEQPVTQAEAALPWPDVTPVLIVTSHKDYARLDDATLFDHHPQTLVVMVDGRAHDPEAGNTKYLLDDDEIETLSERLSLMGSDLVLIDSRETVTACLENL